MCPMFAECVCVKVCVQVCESVGFVRVAVFASVCVFLWDQCLIVCDYVFKCVHVYASV